MPDQQEAGLSRRLVLRGAAGVGAAGIAAVAFSGTTGAAAETARDASRAAPDHHGPAGGAGAGEDIVVHVRDVAAGEIDIYRGTTQTRLYDRELAARLVRASR
jgi:hypothetical protein